MKVLKPAILLVVSLASLGAIAQVDPAAERSRLMSTMWREGLSPINRMVRGQEPYDKGAVERSFARLTEIAAQLQPLWPPGSMVANPTTRYTSSPKVWENKADFDARLARLQTVVADNRARAATDLDGAKAAFDNVNNYCNGCHEVYQVRNR